MTAAHTSRFAPLCADCAHLDGRMCNHPHMPIDLVTGQPAWKASHARSVYSPVMLRTLDFKPCGPEGELFSKRPHEAVAHSDGAAA